MHLNFRKIGETGQPIVILHGLFGMSDNWLTLAKVFSNKHQVYLLDLRNHGHSPHSKEFSYQIMAKDLKDFLIENRIENPILIGHSMGGKVVMQFAIDQPEMFDKMIVVDIAPKFYPVHHTSILQGLHSINLQSLQSRTEANEILKRFEESEAVRQFLLKNLYRNTETGQFQWRFNLPILTKEIAIIGEEITSNEPVANDVLFINGAESSYVLKSDEADILKIFPNAAFKTILGAGHWVQAEKPEEFIEIVYSFIEKK
jgi:esterase